MAVETAVSVVVAHQRTSFAVAHFFKDDRDARNGTTSETQDDTPRDPVVREKWSLDYAFVPAAGTRLVIEIVHEASLSSASCFGGRWSRDRPSSLAGCGRFGGLLLRLGVSPFTVGRSP